MKNTWTKTLAFAMIGMLLLSATACNKNKDAQTDEGLEQSTNLLDGNQDLGQGNQYNDPNGQNNQNNQSNQGWQGDQSNQNDQSKKVFHKSS